MLIFGGEFGLENKFNSSNLLEFSRENLDKKPLGIIVKSEFEGVIANLHEIEFIVCELELAKSLQILANDYLFDSKIAISCQSENFKNSFVFALKHRIDALIVF